jgi:hypothetical protein
MTKENFTSINVIIDRSGSMKNLTNETVSGYNQFVSEQKQVPGEAIFTLCLFNTSLHTPYDCVKISDVPELTAEAYNANGYTALLDAVGSTIDTVGIKLAAMPEEERPSKVIFLIITDGQENSSKEYSRSQVQSMIQNQREKYSWEFVFMGANIDVVKEAQSLGIATKNSMRYTASSAGTKGLYSSVGASMRRYRAASTTSKAGFFDQDPVQVDAVVDPIQSPDSVSDQDPSSNQ